MDIKNLSFETNYEVDSAFDSDRFIKMKLRIMHDNKNPNFSHFGLDAIELARPTLANIPILAHVVEDENGMDFGAHDMTIEEDKMNEGNYKLIFKEIPIGLIPETNEYTIEEFEGRNYVVCYGYIWKQYSNYAQDIIESKEECKLSMEIMVDEYDMLESDKNYFDVKKYKYTGITLLGDKYGTGMLKAKAEKVEFNLDENKENFIKMAEELKFALEQFNTQSTNGDDEATETVVVEPVVTEPTATEPNTETFSLTSRQIIEALNNSVPTVRVTKPELEDGEIEDEWVSSTHYYVMDYDADYAYISVSHYDEESSKYYYVRAKYTVSNTDAVVDKSTFEEIFATWLTKDELIALDAERNKVVMDLQAERHDLLKEVENFKSEVETLVKSNAELQSFKSKIEMETKQSEIEEIIAEFELVLKDNEEFSKIKEIAMSMEIADLEKELYALEGKVKHTKLTGKKDKKSNFSRVAIDVVDSSVGGVKVGSYYGTASKYIEVK